MWYAESLKRSNCNWSLHLKVVSDSADEQMWRYAYNFQYTPSLRMLLARTHQVTRKTDFRLEYKDSDGHYFPLDSDESLNEALAVTNFLDGEGSDLLHLKLEVRMKTSSEANSNLLPNKRATDVDALEGNANSMPSTSSAVHEGIECGRCSTMPIAGTRFKCAICDNFDLCEKCCNAGHHDHHAMMRIADQNATKVP